MTSRIMTPKALLRGQNLIGFVQNSNDGNQVARRASSAKVTTVEPSPGKNATTSPSCQPTEKKR